MRVAVLMLNLGGPRNLNDVRPFLLNLFLDRDAIRFPGGRVGQQVFARLIVALKARKSAANYAQIGGGSPLVQWTRDQGEGMRKLVETNYNVRILCLPCMRFWHPFTEEALREALEWRADHVVAFSQYPHLSTVTTGITSSRFDSSRGRPKSCAIPKNPSVNCSCVSDRTQNTFGYLFR